MPAALDRLQRVFSGERLPDLETRRVRADGVAVDIALSVFPLRDRRGRVVAAASVARDITARKRVEHERQQLAAIVEAAPDAIVAFDHDGTVLAWNRGAERLWGCAASEVLGGKIGARFVPSELQPEYNEHWERVWRGESILDFETRRVRADGTQVEVSRSMFPIFGADGQVVAAAGIGRDLSERKRAEQALAASERRFELVANAAPVGIFSTDASGECTYVNKAWCDLTGLTFDVALGTGWMAAVHPDDIERLGTTRRQARAAGMPLTIEFRFRHPADGAIRWALVRSIPQVGADGQHLGYIGTATDVTEQRGLERQVFQVQKLDAIGRLAGGLAHDFNNILTTVMGRASLLRGALRDDADLLEDVEAIADAAQRASALTRQLLDFARQEPASEPGSHVLVNAAISAVNRLVERVLGRDIVVVAELDDAAGAAEIDPMQLEQVLLNLALNARDAMPSGGRLTITSHAIPAGAPLLPPHLDRSRTYALITVADTGTGIAPEVLDRIFESFFTTKGPGRGSGLGLATSYGIVSRAQGHIAVQSALGHGTSFQVYLPAAALATSEAEAA